MVPFSIRNTRGHSLSAVSTFCSTSRIDTPALVDAVDLAPDLRNQARHDAFGRLVEDDQLRPHHQAARDREHLLLAARQRDGRLLQALLETREAGEHIVFAFGVALAGDADAQVFQHRKIGKDAAPLRHVADALARNLMGRASAEVERRRTRSFRGFSAPVP